MNEKFKTAAEYPQEAADACEIALVRLLQAFTTLKDTVRLIGGLVPRYLTPAGEPGVPAHVGTTDVDVVLDVALIEAGEGYSAGTRASTGSRSPRASHLSSATSVMRRSRRAI